MLFRNYKYFLAAIALFVFGHSSYAAEDESSAFPESQTRWLIDHGVGIGLENDLDFFSNTEGGKRRGTSSLNTLALFAQADGDKLLGLTGVTGAFSIIDSSLGAPSRSLVGSLQRIDNMEPAEQGFNVYLAWLQKTWLDGHLSMLAGVYDLSDEFYATGSSDFFINSTFGFGPEISNIGKHYHASVFPTSAPSLRLKANPLPNWYIQVALSDGINSDPANHPHRLPKLDSNSSAIVMAETGYEKKESSEGFDKLAIGSWRYTSQIHDFLRDTNTDTPLNSGTAQGIYALGEYKLYAFDEAKRSLVAFARIDLTDPEINEFKDVWNVGLVWNRVLPSREQSELGLAISVADNSKQYETNAAQAGLNAGTDEMVIELSYKDALLSWVTVQPDAQYIHNPGAAGLHEDALVMGARIQAKF